MEQLRCKVCGFIINENKLGDICPACGVPRSAFEPYRENISQKRKTILNLDLHPIMIHFPQAFTTIIPPFILLGVAINPMIGHDLLITVKVISILLPFSIAGSIICGLIDGKTRFKRLTTPSLIMKITIASLLQVLTIIMAVVAILYGIEYPGRLFLLFLSLCCLTCQFFLAQIGKTLISAKLPG
jgi:rubredoxin